MNMPLLFSSKRTTSADHVTPAQYGRYMGTIQIGLVLLSCWFFLSFLPLLSSGADFAFAYLDWMKISIEHGFVAGYAAVPDVYPPGTYSVLGIAARIANLYGVSPFTLFKVSEAFFFLAASAVAYWESRDVALTFLFQLSIFVGSLVFSGVDIYFIPFLLGCFIAAKKEHWITASVLFTAAVLIKWQPVFLAPFLLAHFMQIKLARKDPVYTFLAPAAGIAVVLGIAIAVFGPGFITKLFIAGDSSSTSYSAKTLNLGWLVSYAVGPLQNDLIQMTAISPGAWSVRIMQLLFAAAYLGILFKQWRLPKDSFHLQAACALAYASFLILFPGIHSNYWILLTVPLLLMACASEAMRAMLFYISLMSSINLLFVFLWNFPRTVGRIDVTAVLALVNCILFAQTLRVYFRLPKGGGESC